MPSESIAQQQFMAICEHNPKHAKGKCPDMTHQQLHDFAATPHAGLPEHVVPKAKRNSYYRNKR